MYCKQNKCTQLNVFNVWALLARHRCPHNHRLFCFDGQRVNNVIVAPDPYHSTKHLCLFTKILNAYFTHLPVMLRALEKAAIYYCQKPSASNFDRQIGHGRSILLSFLNWVVIRSFQFPWWLFILNHWYLYFCHEIRFSMIYKHYHLNLKKRIICNFQNLNF